jgi:predicted CopG family antitoxin
MAEMGRPTLYQETYIDFVDEYLLQCEDEYTEFHKTRGDKSDTYERLVKVKLPTMEGFSSFINVPIRTIYEWKDRHENFSQSLDKIVKKQKERLISEGLAGTYNPTIAKLILSANHGMAEKSETDVTSGGEKLTFGWQLNT